MTQAAPERPQWAQAIYEKHLARLDRLAEMAMHIGAAIEGEAKAVNAGDGAPPTPEALKAFEIFPRIARSLRLTQQMEDRIVRHLLGEDKPDPPQSNKPDNWEPVTEVRRVIVHQYPDGSPWTRDAEPAEVGESGDRPDREHVPRVSLDLSLKDEAAEANTQESDPAEASIQPQGRMYAPMPGELPPARSPAGGRGAPRDWGL